MTDGLRDVCDLRLSDVVTVGGVDAYSTLGKFEDPILSTFLERSDASLAGLMLHFQARFLGRRGVLLTNKVSLRVQL